MPAAAQNLDEEETPGIRITRQHIRASGAGSIQDMLNQIPGVNAGDTSLSIRGSYRVKVFKDGTVINDPTSSIGGIKWDSVSLPDVAEIVILKGSGAAAYGSNAAGGVVLIKTRKAAASRARIDVAAGTHDTWQAKLAGQTAFNSLQVSANAGYTVTDGYWENADKENKSLETAFQYGRGRQNRFGAALLVLTEKRGYHGTVSFPTPHARHEYDLVSVKSTAAISGISNTTYFRRAVKKNTDPDRPPDKFLRVTETGTEFTKPLLTTPEIRLNAGAGFERQKASATGFDRTTEDQVFSFVNAAGQIGPAPFTYTLGSRLAVHSQFDTCISPEVKLSWQTSTWTLQGSAGLAHNTPSFYQRYNQSSSMSPNPDLDKESARNLSATLTLAPLASVTLGTSLFHNRIRDRITYIRDGTATGRYENLGRVTYKGGELFCDASLARHWKAKAAWSYLEAKDEGTGFYLASSSRHRLRWDLFWSGLENFTARLSGKYTGPAYARSDNSVEAPGFTTWDLRLEYRPRFGPDNLLIYADIKNIGDASYVYAEGYRGSPRTLLAGIRWQF